MPIAPEGGYYTHLGMGGIRLAYEEAWFQDIWDSVFGHTLLSPERCYILYSLCRSAVAMGGDIAEAGVYKGGSAKILSIAARASDKRIPIHLFDSFEGMPDVADRDISGHTKGNFDKTSLDRVKKLLRDFPNVVFHKGEISEQLDNIKDRNFSFVHIDVDLYLTTKACLEFFYPRMFYSGIIVCDDAGFWQYRTVVRRAFTEFFKDKPTFPLYLSTGQVVVIIH